MATFRSKFPSKGEVWLVFSSILFIVNIWAIINILRAVPSWILSRTIWEMLGIISYPLAFAFIESLIFLIGLVMLTVIFPKKVFKDRFVAMGSLAALLVSLGMIIAHLYGKQLGIWSVRDFGQYLLILTGIVIISWLLVFFSERTSKIIESAANRITPLSAIYLVINLFAILLVVLRNI